MRLLSAIRSSRLQKIMPEKKTLYYPDTNVCINFLRNKNIKLRNKFLEYPPDIIKISAIVTGELLTGAHKSLRKEDNIKQVTNFLSQFEIIPFDWLASVAYGQIRSQLEATGKIIGPNDTLIAASVLSRAGVIVTNNVREFSRVEGLFIEDWT